MGKYVSEVIGDNYKNWEMNQIILIEAPTGSGKIARQKGDECSASD